MESYGFTIFKIKEKILSELPNNYISNSCENLYAIKNEKPLANFIIEASKGWKNDQVKSVRLIGSKTIVG